MSKYSKEQSRIIALWVLAKRRTSELTAGPSLNTAPELITEMVNQQGPYHSSDSILLHKHGYDRLLLGRDIGRSVTSLQKEVALELRAAGVVSEIYTVG